MVVFGQLTVSVTRGKDETRVVVQGGSCAFLLFTEKAQTNYIYIYIYAVKGVRADPHLARP